MKKKRNCLFFMLLCVVVFSYGQGGILDIDSVQKSFKAGKIIAMKDNIGSYRLNGLHGKGSFGYCLYDETYIPQITVTGTYWDRERGKFEAAVNSNCYTIIAPVFDYVMPFSFGWGAVCRDHKWSYVSADGVLMCDFVLDAAYPFKEDGSAKVVYKGEQFKITQEGEGLPSEINRKTDSLILDLRAQTIKQLFDERQLERVMEYGNLLYMEILYGKDSLFDISANELAMALELEALAVAAQNELMSTTFNKPEVFSVYRDKQLNRRFSPTSGLYEINRYYADLSFPLFKQKYSSDSLVNQIFNCIEFFDYKSAILLFEKWIENNQIDVDESPMLLLVYYFLAELSDDFETANQQLVNLALLYERDNDYCSSTIASLKGFLLFNIFKAHSAESSIEQELLMAKRNNDANKEIISHYCLFLLYSRNNMMESAFIQLKEVVSALKLKKNTLASNLRCEIMVECISFILKNSKLTPEWYGLLDDYVSAEISYNVDMFSCSDFIRSNKLWGKSLTRIQKFISYLPICEDDTFIKNAFVLSTFQQNIVTDAEKSFFTGVNGTKNSEILHLASEYFKLKQQYKGFDVFDLEDVDSRDRQDIVQTSTLDSQIKQLLLKNGSCRLDNKVYMTPLKGLGRDEIAITVIEYEETSTKKHFAALVARGGLDHITFIPLSEESKDSSSVFWSKIIKSVHLTGNENIFIYWGRLDYYGIENEPIENGELACLTYNIHRVTSLLNINKDIMKNGNRQIALFGGLDYGEEFVAQIRGSIDNGYLEYSKVEIDSIRNIMAGTMMVSAYYNREGTKDKFMAMSSISPEIVHFATHGYQHDIYVKPWNPYRNRFNYYRQNTDVEDIDRLMNSTGLFLSLDEKDTVNILLSREVASCDLSNTKLVVLSACSTVRGENVDNYSGTISLTTAFVISQAHNIIASLWDVDDKKTCEFMTIFYHTLKETNDIHHSFYSTMREMSHKYPNNIKDWGAFVLLEN